MFTLITHIVDIIQGLSEKGDHFDNVLVDISVQGFFQLQQLFTFHSSGFNFLIMKQKTEVHSLNQKKKVGYTANL